MDILHLVSNLCYSSSSTRLNLLAKARQQNLQVCCLGQEGPWTARLRENGIAVRHLDWSRAFDPTPLWKLNGILKSAAPDLIHVWDLQALRSVALVGRKWLSRVVLSRPLAPGRRHLGRFDRWLLGKVGRIVAANQAEAARLAEAGVSAAHIDMVPPGVAKEEGKIAERGNENATAGPRTVDLPRRFILCLGTMEPQRGFREAIWSLDILNYLFEDLHLVLVGDGPERAHLERFAQALGNAGRVHFAGARADVAEIMDQATLCWVPSLASSGAQVALEAMAAGKPVIASAVPCLRELIEDQRTGFLVPPGDKVSLGKRTRALIKDPERARDVGMQAKEKATRWFSAERFVERMAEAYRRAA